MEEVILSSRPSKLIRHIDRLRKLKTEPRPINIALSVTTDCNQNCSFCYVKGREHAELDLEKFKKFIKVVKPLSIDISGGQPTLYKHINELIDFLHKEGIKMGLITNGYGWSKVTVNNWEKLTWIRVSVNDWVENDRILTIPSFVNPYVGIMYVYNKNSPKYPSTISARILAIKAHNPVVKYMKIVEDFTDKDIRIPEHFEDTGLFVVEHTIPRKKFKGICYIGWFKPCVEANGKVYFCTGDVPIDTKRKREGTEFCTIDEPEKLLEYKDFHVDCYRCENYAKNDFIKMLIKDKVMHEEWI